MVRMFVKIFKSKVYPIREEYNMGGIPFGRNRDGRNPIWEEYYDREYIWKEHHEGGILYGRNPVLEESCMGGIPMEPLLTLSNHYQFYCFFVIIYTLFVHILQCPYYFITYIVASLLKTSFLPVSPFFLPLSKFAPQLSPTLSLIFLSLYFIPTLVFST